MRQFPIILKSAVFFGALCVGLVSNAEPCPPWETRMKTFYSCNKGLTKIEANLCNLNDVQLVSSEPTLIEALKRLGAYPFRNDPATGKAIDNEALFRGGSRYKIFSVQNLGSFENVAKNGGKSFYVYRHDRGYKLAVRNGAMDYHVKPEDSWYLPENEIFAWYFGDCENVSVN